MIWISYGLMAFLLIVGMLLIFIILLQRGRGGGLAGALGGMGGQSAFGTKAGDLFTRITVVLAVIWIVLCAGQIPLLRAIGTDKYEAPDAPPIVTAPPTKPGTQPQSPLEGAVETQPPAGEDAASSAVKDEAAKEADSAPKSDEEKPKADDGAKPEAEKPAAEEKKEPAAEAAPADSEKKPE